MALLFTSASSPATPGRQVVLVYDERVALPGLAAFDAAVGRLLEGTPGSEVDLHRIDLDLSRFDSPAYREALRAFLAAKYGGRKVDAVVAVMPPALDFVIENRASLFADSPIVFAGLDRDDFERRAPIGGISGVLYYRAFAPTLALALELHPATRRAFVVCGSSGFDRWITARLRAELEAARTGVELVWLPELPLPQLLNRLRELPRDSIVLYTTLFRDGAGQAFVTHEVVERISETANAPTYGFLDQLVGRGIVGGRVYGWNDDAEQVGRIVQRILDGESAERIPLVESDELETVLDWRQLERWGVAAGSLPAGAEILFRPMNPWREYRWEIAGAGVVLILQMGLIGGLLLHRARRRRAENAQRSATEEMQRNRVELAHMARVATMGELTAAVAHELRQPLAAILTNTEAAELLLAANPPAVADVRESLADIRSDGQRAGHIISRMRSLLERHEIVRLPLSVNETAEEVLSLLRIEAAQRKVEVRFDPAAGLPEILGDRVHLQQVLMNLVLNGIEAMAAMPEGKRHLVVATRENGGGMLELSVRDNGPGIPQGGEARLFEPFWTTKPHGLGMGLSISRSIVESHDGSIRVEKVEGGGALFRVVLPVRPEGRPDGVVRA